MVFYKFFPARILSISQTIFKDVYRFIINFQAKQNPFNTLRMDPPSPVCLLVLAVTALPKTPKTNMVVEVVIYSYIINMVYSAQQNILVGKITHNISSKVTPKAC